MWAGVLWEKGRDAFVWLKDGYMDIYPYIHIEDDRLMAFSIYFKIAQLQPWIRQSEKSSGPATQIISIQSSKELSIDKGSFADAYRPCIGQSGWLG